MEEKVKLIKIEMGKDEKNTETKGKWSQHSKNSQKGNNFDLLKRKFERRQNELQNMLNKYMSMCRNLENTHKNHKNSLERKQPDYRNK
jgi:hypothetical protein